jgi:hypothetical protein
MISQVEGNPENAEGGVHIPILAEGIFVFCPSCGNSMSRDNLREVIHALLNAEEEEPHW